MLKWPEKAYYRRQLEKDLGLAVWYVLDQLLPKEDKSRKSMRIKDLSDIVRNPEKDIHLVKDHPLLIYTAKDDSLAPFLRTEIACPELFYDSPGIGKELELKTSPVHGQGCFTRINYHKGAIIRNAYKGVARYLWDLEDWSRDADCYNMACPLAPDLLAYCPLSKNAEPVMAWQNPYVFYANQQELPNHKANVCFYTSTRYPWLVWLKALAPIRAGQELLLDTYGPSYDF